MTLTSGQSKQASKQARDMCQALPEAYTLKACGGLPRCWTPTYLRQSLNHSIQQGAHACGHLQ